jgi:hypothetical protein
MSLAEARRSGRHDGAGVARRAASAADPARVPGESQKISCKRAPRVAVVRAAVLTLHTFNAVLEDFLRATL